MTRHPTVDSLIRVLFWTALLSGVLNGFIRIPGLPYNVRELLGSSFSVFDLTLFSLALVWLGLGGVLVARMADKFRGQFLILPLLVVLAASISFLLVNASVSGESLRDIVGSPTVWRDAVIKRLWGHEAADFFPMIATRNIVDQLEYAIRYIALYSPLVFILAAISAGWLGDKSDGWQTRLRRSAVTFAYGLPWLFLCKFVVINWAGTDNITELIDTQALWGAGGALYLLVLLILITFCATLLAGIRRLSWRDRVLALLFLGISVPLSWILAKNGLAAHITKDGLDFSALDFLLGPNRKDLLSETQLQLRWTAVYCGLCILLAVGISSAPRQNKR